MQEVLWDVWFYCLAVWGARLFFMFSGFGLFWWGCFLGFFFLCGFLLFSFFSTKFPCLSSLWEFAEWSFLLCCQKASAPGASALSCFHWVIDPYSVSGCQNRGETDKAEHWCSIVLWEQCSWVVQAYFQVMVLKAELEKLLDWSQLRPILDSRSELQLRLKLGLGLTAANSCGVWLN